jgi:hypothetical protein
VKVNLYYPSFKYGGAPKGWALGDARLTRTMLIVESAGVVSGPIRIGRLPLRFYLNTLLPVGDWPRGWMLDGPSTRAAIKEAEGR